MSSSLKKYFGIFQNFGPVFTTRLFLYKFLGNDDAVNILIENKLYSLYSNILDFNGNKEIDAEPCAWTFWWQGEDSMPDIVKICYRSQLKYVRDAGVRFHLLTKDNISEFIEIPKFILDKVNKGIITLTHLSDIIRILLLEKYGGMWLDSTLLFTKPINTNYLKYDFFSVKLDPDIYKPIGFGQKLTCCKWAGFILSTSKKHSYIFSFLKETILEYWNTHTSLIDYFLMNRLIKLVYNRNDLCRRLIDDVPYTNDHLYLLKDHLNSKYEEEAYNKVNKNTLCFKLSYKMELNTTINCELTNYGYLYQSYIKDL